MSFLTGIRSGTLSAKFEQPGAHRLGINYDSGTGTFTIRGANGRDLSAQNPGYVTIPSKSNPGQLNTYAITSNFQFIDDVGSSQIIDNNFGTDAGDAWSSPCPFYLYFAINDSENDVKPFISRVPHKSVTPASSEIGYPSNAAADNQTSMWCFDNITATEWDSNPCILIGSFRMTKTTLNDWTVQSLSNNEGIGQYNENVRFSYPLGQNGAVSNSHFLDTGGTKPFFDIRNYTYTINRFGYYYFYIAYQTVSNTPSGSQQVAFTLPLRRENDGNSFGATIHWMDSSASSARSLLVPYSAGTNTAMYMFPNGGTGFIGNTFFATGDRIMSQGWSQATI